MEVAKLVQVVHVTVNARSDADLDAAAIMKRVATASGANYSNRAEKANPAFANTAPATVGTSAL